MSLLEEEVLLVGWLPLSSSVMGEACKLELVVCLQEQSVKGWLW